MSAADLNLQDLRRVAEGATKGPWNSSALHGSVAGDQDADGWTRIAECPCPRSPSKSARYREWTANALHIATFDPPTVMALLDRISLLEGERESSANASRARTGPVARPDGEAEPSAAFDPATMTKDEKSAVLYLETCIVDHGGLVEGVRMNAADHEAIERLNAAGLLWLYRIPARRDGMTELLPCPFCGGTDLTVTDVDGITCWSCHASVCNSGVTPDEETWNRRAAPPTELLPGWVMVPSEPTEEMIAAAEASLDTWRKSLSRDEAMLRHYIPPPRKSHKFIASATPEEKHAIRYAAMLQAAPPTPAIPVWSTIESAPRDGTTILAAHTSNGARFTVYWDEGAGGWADGSTDSYDDLRTYSPSHWQPLPEPPTPSAIQSREGE